MGLFDKAFNAFADSATSLNRSINKTIGKDVFQDVKRIEEPRAFVPLSDFGEYQIAEPEQWSQLTGECKQFSIEGNIISVSAELDTCLQYRAFFKAGAEYYTERFKFKYQNCVKDFDSLVHYFSEIYIDGLMPMVRRAHELLLMFGVFTVDTEAFTSRHMETYKKAITSYQIMLGIEATKNQAAENLGEQVGGSIRMTGGGFGLKGAMKGAAKATAFNMGMGLVGKFVANQSKMSQEEKAKVFAAFKHDVFFEEVKSDFYATFFTLIQFLVENGVIDGITTTPTVQSNSIFKNLQSPMFPVAQLPKTMAKLISENPFVPAYFEILEKKLGPTEEVETIVSYFVG